jgi:2,3-bisphosphoglycerate-dependent phosphoglycerate mutase
MKQANLVLIRHGESVWNKKNIFTGWVDVGLSKKGEAEAKEAGRLLRRRGYSFDRAYTSVLKRAIKTLALATKAAGIDSLPTVKSWRLNERHYGALQGKNKKAIEKEFGTKQFLAWRRSYTARPPLLTKSMKGQCTPAACGLKASEFPKTESLQDAYKRVIPFWKKEILPGLKKGDTVLISAHGNSLRALVKYLDGISDQQITRLEIPTGKPLCYQITTKGIVQKKWYLK